MELGSLLKSQLLKINYKGIIYDLMQSNILPEIHKRTLQSDSAWDDFGYRVVKYLNHYLKKDELVIEEMVQDFFENFLLPELKKLAESTESNVDNAVVDGFFHLYTLIIKPKLGIQ